MDEKRQKKEMDLEVNSFVPLYQQLYDNIKNK
ncbi:hypothetical protein BN1095_690013 [Clostridioides difficile]|uniref:Uncharacterized protein n=1 Tax=Clostridioides difficile TaxID=1496 RepID=A0A069AYS1_CLODI|nr:hypothetical protein BN1095_690013 [Clostridioides difficile]